MPANRVRLSFDQELATAPREQRDDVTIFVRTGGDEQTPQIDFNDPQTYQSAAAVAEDFGENSDAHEASRLLQSRGLGDWQVIALESEQHIETLGDSDNTPTDTGTASNDMSGHVEATVSVDGEELSVTPVAQSPPDTNQTPNNDEALVNYDTGEVVTGQETSGSDSGIEVEYVSQSFSPAFDALNARDEDIAIYANLQADRSDLGDLDELVVWGVDSYVTVPVAYSNGATFDTEDDAIQQAHEMTRYLQAASLLPIAHRSPDDVAASIAGLLATEDAWEDPSIDGRGMPGVSQPTSYTDAAIGEPGAEGTFEGGDDQGMGGTNVLMTEVGTLILSNSLSGAGAGSDYRYIDLFRTEGMVAHETETALISVLMQHSPNFTETGQEQVHNAIDGALSRYEGDTGAYSDLEINVPNPDDLPEADRGNRVWTGIGIAYRINGSVHQFEVDITSRV